MALCLCFRKNKAKIPPKLSFQVHPVYVNHKEDDVMLYYEVCTKINNKVYKKLHLYPDFVKLSDEIREQLEGKYTCAPCLKIVPLNGYLRGNSLKQLRAQRIEEFLTELCDNPYNINDKILAFLGVKKPYKKLFLRYQKQIRSVVENTAAGEFLPIANEDSMSR
jgi:hypothetical protein